MSSEIPASGRCDSGTRASGAFGLVSSQTSDTLLIDQGVMRVSRMRKGVLNASRLITEGLQAGGFRWFPVMLTLTYREDIPWTPRHITTLLKAVREWSRRRGVSIPYVWVMELTQRERPHYHVMLWLPKGLTLPKPDKQGWWPWGHTRIERARKAVGYMAKYTSKGGDGSQFPKGARIHGCGGLKPDQRAERTWWSAPRWVRELWPEWRDLPRPAKGGGWASRVTGELFRSPWRVFMEGGRVFVRWAGFGEADLSCALG